MNKQVEQIKAEIERLKSELIWGACAAGVAMETGCKNEAYNEVLAFIDSLPDEPTTEGLEEEVDKRWKEWLSEDSDIVEGELTKGEFLNYARHFAERGAENLKR